VTVIRPLRGITDGDIESMLTASGVSCAAAAGAAVTGLSITAVRPVARHAARRVSTGGVTPSMLTARWAHRRDGRTHN
jgi:hypothetical protein